MAVRIQFRRGTAAEWVAANPTLAAGELGYESDTGQFKIGNGSADWANLMYGAVSESYVDNAIANVIDLAPGALDTLNELAAAINDDANFFSTINNNIANAQANAESYADDAINTFNLLTTGVHGISDTTLLVFQDQMDNAIADSLVGYATELYVSNSIGTHSSDTTDVHGISNTANIVMQADLGPEISNAIEDFRSETLNVHGIANTANVVLTQDLSNHASETLNVHGIANTLLLATTTDLTSHASATLNVHGIANTAELVTSTELTNTLSSYAELDAPTFTGNVSLPNTTTIGDISYTELSYLNNASSNIQDQLDSKLGTSSAESIYAKLDGAIFTGNVVLTANTSIGLVSSIELGYLDGVTSAIQTQLDEKAPTASPTFTGTVSGITATMVGLGNVDNTSDLDKPVSNAVQTALDLKANLASPTFTGEVEAADVTITGNLIVQGTTTTVSASDLKLRDNMIYLNQAGSSVITAATHGSGNTVFTTQDAHGYQAGDFVTIANVVPSSFNISGDGVEILAVTSNTFTIAATTSDTYTSGGTARGKVHFNPDLGWAAGRYADNTYAHAGLFRDATDGVFKFFDGYVPEPDESVFIDTAHNTFALADVSVADLTAANVIATTGVVFPDNTIQTSAGVPSLTTFTEKTSSYTLDTLDHQDNVVEINSSSATTFTIPTNATLAWPIGASMDILQTGTGQVTIAGAVGVTVNSTPGLKLRTRWSSCTIMKRGTDSWIVYGDLTA